MFLRMKEGSKIQRPMRALGLGERRDTSPNKRRKTMGTRAEFIT